MEVVEGDDAVPFESVDGAQPEFRRQAANRRRQMGHHDCANAVGDWIAGEDENGTFSTSTHIGKPDLAPLHWWNTSVQSVSSSGHASFGQAAVSVGVSGCNA